MFDQVKVNQKSIINLLKIPERENPDIGSNKTGSNFLSMLLEKTNYNDKKGKDDNKLNQIQEPQKNNEKIEPEKIGQNNKFEDNTRIISRREREGTSSNDEISKLKENDNSESKSEKTQKKNEDLTSKDVKKSDENSVKEVKIKKNNNKEHEDEIGIINQLHGEANIKNLMELVKAAFNGNKKAEDENFQKLFNNLKSKRDKDNINSSFTSKKNDGDKNPKNFSGLFDQITRDLKESISRELFKNVDTRKSAGKPLILNDKELKELAINIIESIKKNKAKEIVKHEARIISNDDVKNEKKQVFSFDQQPLKKLETSDESGFEKNGAKDKNSGKETFSYNGGKIDFSGKSGLDKMEHALKMSDFKENLQEIIDKAKVSVRDSKNGTFTMKLNPQELGNVNVNLIIENGVITGKFLVDNEDVKSMLLSSLNDLKYQLEEAGIAVGEFSVNVNDQREKYLNQKDDGGSKPFSFDNSDRDVIAAADQYDSNTAAYTGHINMVI